jgi:dTDP-4-amino-4,6-dideoxygalactose transaminase
MTSGRYILGSEVSRFEKAFADYVGVRYAVGVGSGTEALHLGLRACGVGPGDEVVTVSHTAVATIAAVEMCGAVPVLVDIDLDSYTINPGAVERAMTERTKAIVPVHLYGQPSNLKPLIAAAKRHHLFIVEDCAQAHGAIYHGRKVGSWGDVGIFSFYPTKNLGALGDAGAVVTNRGDLFDKLLALRQYGWDRERVSRMAGFNSRLDELQAAILIVKLKQLDEDNRQRGQLAGRYDRLLEALDVTLPTQISNATHVYHQYVIRCADRSTRDGLAAFMSKEGIQTGIHYPVPVHLQAAYVNRLGVSDSLPMTEEAAETILSLPMFPELTQMDLEKVASAIRHFFAQSR